MCLKSVMVIPARNIAHLGYITTSFCCHIVCLIHFDSQTPTPIAVHTFFIVFVMSS